MRKPILATLAAVAMAGAVFAGGSPANAAREIIVKGPGGTRVEYVTGYYVDRDHRRHMYRHPRDWQQYHRPLAWYRAHGDWYRHNDWYR
jgi:hypothetical protein